MGKGKKKDQNKNPKDNITLSSLTISDPAPSTSQAPSENIEEESVGLGRKRNQPKKKNIPVSSPMETSDQPSTSKSDVATDVKQVQSAPVTATSESTSSQPAANIPKRKEEDDDGEGLGLDLGGRKRNRRKKKKDDAPAPVAGPSVPAKAEPIKTAPPLDTVKQSQPAAPPSAWASLQSKPTPQVQQTPIAPQTLQQPAVKAHPVPGPSTVQVDTSSAASKKYPPQRATGPYTQHTVPCLFKIPDKIIKPGVSCRHIRVLTNYLEMTIMPLKIHRYDVDFKPEKPKKFLPIAYQQVVGHYFKNIPIGFDQRKNLYALSALPGIGSNERFTCNTTVLDQNNREIEFEVSFKFTGVVDYNTILSHMKNGGSSLNPPTEAIQAIDVILRQGTLESYVKSGRNFFKRPSRPIHLGDGLEMWNGLFQSAIFTSRAFINIDVAHKAFPKQQLLIDAYINEFRLDTSKKLEEQKGKNVESFLHFLKALKVVAYIGGDKAKGSQREFICNGLVPPAYQLTFKINEGTSKETKMTVADYFAKEKKCPIRYPNLNCVWVGPRDKNIYYPMEFLTISYGQIYNKQLNEAQLSAIVKESATPPNDRKKKIEEIIKDMNYPRNQFFKKFGLDISNQFLNVDAKVLTAPKMEVGGQVLEPRRGVWNARKLLKPQILENWVVLAVDTYRNNSFEHISDFIISVGNQMGMCVKPPHNPCIYINIGSLNSTLETLKRDGIQFVFVVISSSSKDVYHKLKSIAELRVGMLTQCIKEFTATRKMNDATVRNIMLKVNSKLMGINHALDSRSVPNCLKNAKVMVVGADVTHPSPDQSSIPSIAGVTASLDPKFSLYNIGLSVQAAKKEMIVEFEDMIVDHLNEFEKRNRDLPSKIYVFRDGVSEGQFAQVMNSELQAIHNAYRRKAGGTVRPEVLFLLVQKRHHTRLFVPDSTSNVEPGTVVDSQIVHPRELDFYLVSHQAIKGTARPTRYHAVSNDGCISQDEVEQLTYYLCHLYSRCMRSVSYPTPTYYAHLACMRARSLTYGDKFNNSTLEKKPERLRVMESMLQKSKMFFV